ncbi:TetR/AcrR family transcriptional regulator [Luteococcus sediminum]
MDPLADEPGVRERKKRETRRALHRAATELVLEHGLAAVTTDAIARRAGVSPRTFFNYFPTKEAALAGVPEVIVEKITHLVAERPVDEDLWATARLVATTLAHISLREPELWRQRRRMMANQPEAAALVMGSERALELGLVESLVARAQATPTLTQPWRAPMLAMTALNAVRVATQVGDDPEDVEHLLREILDFHDALYA